MTLHSTLKSKDYVLFACFVVFWLIPMGYRGMTHGDLVPGTPGAVSYFHNISCLFTQSVSAWDDFYVQARTYDNDEWFQLEDSAYSPMKPFGHRARVDRMIARFSRRRGEPAALQMAEFAVWLNQRYTKLGGDVRGLRAVRFVRVRHRVGPALANEPGPWIKQPLTEIPAEDIDVIAEFEFTGSQP